ncbi:hypothetical protein ACEWK1_17255, partial [Metabacillus sp. YM-086]|uniref:hypothetical protein n=1 Tax=Metabacillus sp. YM-086 TaxID=3341729 RepID=UPI003A8A2C15
FFRITGKTPFISTNRVPFFRITGKTPLISTNRVPFFRITGKTSIGYVPSKQPLKIMVKYILS